MHTIKVFAKAGQDIETSAMSRYQQQFGLDIQFSALVHNFNLNFFKLTAVPGWTSYEFPALANTRTLCAIISPIIFIKLKSRINEKR